MLKKHHPIRNTLLVLLLLILCAAGAAAYTGYRFYQQAMQVKDHEMQAVSLLKNVQNMKDLQSADALDQLIPQVKAHTAAAKEIAHGDLWQRAAQLPKYGTDIQTVQGMTDVVDSVVTDTLPKLSGVMKTLLGTSLSNGDGQVNLQPIVDAQSGFNDTSTLLQQQLEQLEALPQPTVPQVKSAYDQSVEQFTQITQTIKDVNDTLQVLPQFLGVNGARTYVVVAQTTSESRSSGGLVGSLGTMTADNGKIEVGDFHPNARFLNTYYGGSTDEQNVFDGPLVFRFDVRDTTANPDFDKVAERIRTIWNYSAYSSTKVDGVMMIDPVFIQEMVKLSGNITLDNGVTLTGDNTAEYLLNTIYKTVAISKQDYYFEYVAKTAMNNMFKGMKIDTMMKMVQSLGSLAEQRHLYMYTFHEDEAQNFQNAGFAKSSPSSEENPEVGIYLNQQNASKLDWYIKRKTVVTHTGTNADGSQNYHVSFTMTNTIPENDVSKYSWYLVGGNNGVGGAGTAVEKMLFYGPVGGSISNLKASGTGKVTDNAQKAKLNGKSLLTSVVYLASGASVTYDFDVTTSAKATAQLGVDQTPMGWLDTGVTYNR
ncbi:DUF4012 domain-containing protein [Bifidobacterium avesanii]|uniref:DUF4012 domain-containing protein n=1 Tax=Bifidobacterium avesanii TaxID=1798157 RepID=UPI001F0E9B13|nr:DUF4012 domain-containing protein [Bifidobacterium avesanii]